MANLSELDLQNLRHLLGAFSSGNSIIPYKRLKNQCFQDKRTGRSLS